MARGLDADRERKGKVSWFGKDLARRAKSKCELSEVTGEKLEIFEIPPVKEEPNFDRCILITSGCKKLLENLDKATENDVRFFNNSVWSETPIIKAVSIAALRKMEKKHPWASDILETVYIEEELEELIESIEL